MSLQLFGVDDVVGEDSPLGSWGGIVGPILSAGGQALNAGLAMKEADDKKKQSAADDAAKLTLVKAADVSASVALAKAKTSEQQGAASAGIDQVAAQQALSAQDRAGAGLSANATAERVKAVENELTAATKKAQASPKDIYLINLVSAWQATMNKASSGNITASAAAVASPPVEEESFLTKKVGPLPVYGYIGGAAGLGVVALIARKYMAK